jgi:NAD+ kinase
MSIATIGLFGIAEKAGIQSAVESIVAISQRAGVQVRLSEELASHLPAAPSVSPIEELVGRVDVLVALGGDGTMLRAARAIDRCGTPLLGINLGALGYLTDVPLSEVEGALTRLFAGEYHLDERAQIQAIAWRGQEREADLVALNDVAINMGPLPRALELELRIDGEWLGRFLGDGILFSTPTGSTAYNLSAGGPICHCDVPALLVTPICPHTLGMRPLIVHEQTSVEVFLHRAAQTAQLTADGQATAGLRSGDRVELRAAPWRTRLIKFPQSSFYRVLRRKLNWGGLKLCREWE